MTINPYIPINTHTYLTIPIYTHTYPSISIYTNKCIPIQIHIYPYIPLYTHTYPYIPIHTHTYPNITIHIYLPKNTLHNVIQVILSLRVYPLVIYFGEGYNFSINAQGHLSKTLLTSLDSNNLYLITLGQSNKYCCPTPSPSLFQITLGRHLQVNNILAWGIKIFLFNNHK